MKKKFLVYGVLPVLAVIFAGAGIASAQGFKMGWSADPEEMASRMTAMFQERASILGITIDEMKNYWADGKNIKEIAEEKGITDEQLRTKMQELRKNQMKEQLQAMVSKGVITQAQADKRLEKMSENQGKGFFGGVGGKGGMKRGGFKGCAGF
jgi:hypothetical protein